MTETSRSELGWPHSALERRVHRSQRESVCCDPSEASGLCLSSPLLLPVACPTPTPTPPPGLILRVERAYRTAENGLVYCRQLCGRSGLGEASRPELEAVTEARRLQSGAGWRSYGSPEGSPRTYFRVPQSCQEVCGGTESKHSGGLQSETACDLLWPGAVMMVKRSCSSQRT